MSLHKFKIANPCGPCEWHIEKGVKIFTWFDAVFQAIFVIPVILQFRIHVEAVPDKPVTNETVSEPDNRCDANLIDLAIIYSTLDMFNLCGGILMDLIMIFAVQKCCSVTVKRWVAWIFITLCFVRECLHVTGMTIHMIRCVSSTYPYEIVVRLLCQYLMFGIWIIAEYISWLNNGCKFVPKRGMMEPPVLPFKVTSSIDRKITLTSITSSPVATWSGGDESVSQMITTVPVKGGSSEDEGGENEISKGEGEEKNVKRKSARKSKRRSRKLVEEGGIIRRVSISSGAKGNSSDEDGIL